MAQKNLRLKEIREILKTKQITRQEDLLNILMRRGFDITQATLSRDLASLQVARKSTAEGSVYFIPDNDMANTPGNQILYGAKSLRFAANLGVIKTLPGYANSVGAIIDEQEIPALLGTVAGNDTVLLILDSSDSVEAFIKHLGAVFHNVHTLL